MAIIGRIRKHSGLVVVFVGIAIAAFVIGDFGRKQYKGTTDVGSVNGENIPYTEFNTKVEEMIQMQKDNTQNDKISEDEAFNIRQSTWNNMVKEVIMEDECSTLGLTVSSDELFDQIQGKNPHRYILQYFKDPKTNQYDPQLVLNYLKNLDKMEQKDRDQWLRFEKAVKEDRLQTKFNNLISKGYYLPKAFLKREYVNQNRKLNLRSISVQASLIKDDEAKLTDADYQKYYDKNKHFYILEEETREADYVVFDVFPSDADKKKIAEDVESIYKEFSTNQDVATFAKANTDGKYDSTFKKKGSFPGILDSLCFSLPVGSYIPPFEFNSTWYMTKVLAVEERPDTMKATHVLISWAGSPLNNENIKRNKDQAKKLADSLFEVLKKSPEKIKEFALKYSDYPTAKDDGGEIKEFVDGDPNFSLFFTEGMKLKPNDPKNDMKVIETAVGYSVFKLTFKSKPVKKSQAAILERKIEPSNQTFQDTYMKASTFAGQNTTSQAFEKTATEKGFSKRTAENIREMDNYVQGMSGAREIVRWTFAENTKIGDVSPVFDLSGKYVVAMLKGINEKGYPPMDKLKEKIKPGVLNDKKLELVAEKVRKALSPGKDIYALATEFNCKVDTLSVTFGGFNGNAIGRDFKVTGKLFTIKNGVLDGPFTGNYNVYMAIIDNVLEPPATEDYSGVNLQLVSGFSNRVTNNLFEAIKKSAEIEDSRARFF